MEVEPTVLLANSEKPKTKTTGSAARFACACFSLHWYLYIWTAVSGSAGRVGSSLPVSWDGHAAFPFHLSPLVSMKKRDKKKKGEKEKERERQREREREREREKGEQDHAPLSILTKKKDKIKLKSAAFRSKLQATHESTKKHAAKTSKRLKSKKKRKHSLDFASFESTLEGLGARYGAGDDGLRMRDVRVTSGKQRVRVMEAERGRMAAVLNHPVYKEDPLKAILGHLHATLGGAADDMDGGE